MSNVNNVKKHYRRMSKVFYDYDNFNVELVGP